MTPGVNIKRYEVDGELTRERIKKVLDLSNSTSKVNRVDSLDNWKTLVERTTPRDYEALYNWRRLAGGEELKNKLKNINDEEYDSKSQIEKILFENGTYSDETISTKRRSQSSNRSTSRSGNSKTNKLEISESIGDDERIILARQRWENIKASIGIERKDEVVDSYKYWDRLAYAPKEVKMIATDFEKPYSSSGRNGGRSKRSTTSSKGRRDIQEVSTNEHSNKRSITADSNSKVALYNWNLVAREEEKSEASKEIKEEKVAINNWEILTEDDDTVEIPRKEAFEHWKLLNTAVKTTRTKEWKNAVKSTSFDEFEAYLNWERLILGDVIQNGSSRNASIYPEEQKTEDKKKIKKSFVQIVKEKLFPKLAAKQEKKKAEDAEENWSNLVNDKKPDVQSPKLSEKNKSQISAQNISIENKEYALKENDTLLNSSPLYEKIDHTRDDNELRLIKEEVISGNRVLTFHAANSAKDIIVTLSSQGVSGAQVDSSESGNVHVTLHSKIDEDYNVCMSIVGGIFKKEYKLMELSRTFGSMDKSEKQMTRQIIEKLKIQIENDDN